MSAPTEIPTSYGVPASQLSDAELEHQGSHAHATRNWVFLHGTADQFRHHTERMLELEQEYLRRHPKRTWQGSGGADGGRMDLAEMDVLAQVRFLTRTYATAVETLIARMPSNEPAPAAEAPGSGGASGGADQAEAETLTQIRHLTRAYATTVEQLLGRHSTAGTQAQAPGAADPAALENELLRRYAAAPDGRLHKLEAHQAAREIGLAPAAVAALYKADPPLLVTAGEYRQITPAVRARIEYA